MALLAVAKNELLTQLQAALYQWRETHPGGSTHLLLDLNHPVQYWDALHPSQIDKRAIKTPIEKVKRPDLSSQPELHPLLVQLSGPGDNGIPDPELLEMSVQAALERCSSVNGAYVAAWLCTTADMPATTKHLGESGLIFDLGRGKRRFEPIFEPHRLALLLDDDAAQPYLERWFGPVSKWWFVDVNGQLRASTNAPARLSEQTPGRSPALALRHFEMLGRVSTARVVVMALQKAGYAIATQPERAIDASLVRARSAGLRHLEDIVFYALNDFTLNPAWASHPTASKLIKSVLAGSELRLAAAMAALPDDALDEIASTTSRRDL